MHFADDPFRYIKIVDSEKTPDSKLYAFSVIVSKFTMADEWLCQNPSPPLIEMEIGLSSPANDRVDLSFEQRVAYVSLTEPCRGG